MESNEQLDNLILSYLSNQTGWEQEQAVIAWINADEGNRQYFEELKRTWILTSLNKTGEPIDVDVEWKRFKERIAAAQAKIAIIDEGQTFDEAVIQLPKSKRPVYRIIMSVTVAASVLLMVALKFNWFGNPKLQRDAIVKAESKNTGKPTTSFHHELNTSGKEKKIVLEDGSEVLLANESELSYAVPFANNKRDILLKGKANFKVSKDKNRPFTVSSGEIATTALGTMFTVTNYEKDNQIIVRLFEGKVVIKSAETAKEIMPRDYYLLAGQQLIYNKQRNIVSVTKFTLNNNRRGRKENVVTGKTEYDEPSLPRNKKGTWYMFNNRPLPEVLDQLQAMYAVEIVYPKNDLSKVYFIGKFDKTDSIESILKRIASSNNMQVRTEGNKFILY